MRRRIFANLVLATATIVGFVGAAHLAATGLIRSQQTQQLNDMSRSALRRAEASVDFVSSVLGGITAQRAASCDPQMLQSIRLNVYQSGAVKDLRVTDGRGVVLCSAYPETLKFDQGWAEHEEMLPTSETSLRLFRVDQVFGSALGVLKEPPGGGVPGIASGLAAVLGFSGSTYDIMPAELLNRSTVTLELTDGRIIAQTAMSRVEVLEDTLDIQQSSSHLPLRAVVKVERAALAAWGQESYWPIMGLAFFLGVAFAMLLLRASNRPIDPVRDLDRAIAAREFKPFLQPIFSLRDNRITGAEILARRILSDGTVVPPSRFVELAENSGRIGAITWMLLSQALRDLQPLFNRDPDFRVSVNIAPSHFMEATFIHDLERTVAASGVPAARITLELTEREAFTQIKQAARTVQLVQAKGFSIALDDVGTGHSGLSQIQSLRADVLKIDKFFVDGLGRDASATLMVEMLVRLAGEMNMGVVAEGIEEELQARALRDCGVASGQGYLVSPPLPAAGFLQLIDERAMREALAEPGDEIQPVAA